jgi:hypothetical protein
MVDDGKGVGPRHKAPTNSTSKGPDFTPPETKLKQTDGATESRKILAFKVSQFLVGLIIVWFW